MVEQLEDDIIDLNEIIEHKNSEIGDLLQEVNSLKIEIRKLKQELNDKCAIIEQYELNPHQDFLKILKENDVKSIQINL